MLCPFDGLACTGEGGERCYASCLVRRSTVTSRGTVATMDPAPEMLAARAQTHSKVVADLHALTGVCQLALGNVIRGQARVSAGDWEGPVPELFEAIRFGLGQLGAFEEHEHGEGPGA